MDWEKVARAQLNPLRIAVLEQFYEARGPLSAVMIAHAIDQPVGRVAYHVRQVYKAGLIKPAGTRQRRGATEHFYRATFT